MPRPPSMHPETWKFGYPIFHAESRDEWRAWLTAHHDSAPGVWLCSWKRAHGGPTCPYPEAVEEAICFGWIDSTVNTLDEDRSLQLFTPRKPKSPWSRLNRRRAADMETARLMTDAGRRSIEAAQANGWWTIADPVEDLAEPPELAEALDGVPAARTHWNDFPKSARKQMLWWVISATRAETRSVRIAAIVQQATLNEHARG